MSTNRSPLTIALALAFALILQVPSPAVAAQRGAATHAWPVRPAFVTRTFTELAADWLPGHRGVDLAAAEGTEVRASGPGEVVFAGSAGGLIWVTVDHGGGLRTSVGPVRDVLVRRGDTVFRGQPLASAAPVAAHDGVHWSARRDGLYLDPRSLVRGNLVPRLVGPGGWEPADLVAPIGYQPWDGRDRTLGLLPSTDVALEPGWRTAPNPNHVIAVAGLLTASGATPLPVDYLGFPADTITQLSHEGRIAVGPLEVDDPLRDQLPYSAADTFLGVDRAARLLKAQLQAQWARNPGVAVDLIGHSFGGVVIMHYLMALHDPADPALPPIGHVVTLAAPLQGADAASAAANPLGLGVLRAAVDIAGIVLGVGPDPATLDDLAVGSPLLQELATSWALAQSDPHRSPLASGTRVLTIGGSRDVVVPEHRSDLVGADHVTVPGGHTGMHTTEAVLQVVRAFLADQDVAASSGGWGAWLSPGVSLAEQLVGIVL